MICTNINYSRIFVENKWSNADIVRCTNTHQASTRLTSLLHNLSSFSHFPCPFNMVLLRVELEISILHYPFNMTVHFIIIATFIWTPYYALDDEHSAHCANYSLTTSRSHAWMSFVFFFMGAVYLPIGPFVCPFPTDRVNWKRKDSHEK